MSAESAVQTIIRLEAARKGILLFRNNVGALQDKEGRYVRYGLANDSSAVNREVKSADLIGIRPVIIHPYHVGQRLGVFVSREIKAPDWRYNPNDEREQAQMRWIKLVEAAGGDACFAWSEGTL